jgi:thiosulfate/3-mercaptopyruvate sulfurtransferase
MKPIISRRRVVTSMNLFLILLLPSILFISSGFKSPGNTGRVLPVVTCSWLQENLTNSDLVVLHVSAIKLDYDNGHIPGARFLWPGYISISTEEESVVPADEKELKKILQQLGVSSDSHIVLCGIYGNIVQVCRVFVTLEHIGFRGKVSILDGGFDLWKSSGGKVSVDKPLIAKGKLSTALYDNLVDAEWMLKNLDNKSYSIVDARAKAAYDGTTGTPRQGHIKGAKNLPPVELYDNKTFCFLPADKLKENFAKLEIPTGARPVFYCNSGSSASVAYVGALILGYDPIVYDGSMEEWGSRLDLPMEKNEESKK